MFSTRLRLFRLLGIPISIDASWLIILALLTWNLSTGYPGILHSIYPGEIGTLPFWAYWVMGFITAVAFFGCIVLHELGHAVVARSRGMPINGITLFLLGGVAEIGEEPPSPSTEFLMAIAGPLVSVILAIIFGTLAVVGYQSGWWHPLVLVLGSLGFINAAVLVFNLVPAFPLDGGRVLRSILWAVTNNVRRATLWAARLGQLFAWFLFGAAIWYLFLHRWVDAVWFGFIGWFLNSAAQSSYRQVVIRQALQGEPVRRFMNPRPIVVTDNLDLHHLVDEFVYRYHHKAFPVVTNGHLEGCVDTQAVAQVPRDEWDRHIVAEVMRHDLPALTIRPEADAVEALSKMQRNGLSRLMVAEGDNLVGIISLKDLLRFLDLKLHLEDGDGDHRGTMPPEEAKQQDTFTPISRN